MKKYFSLMLSLYGLCLLNGCGGGGGAATPPNSTTPPPPPLVITSAAPPAGTLQSAYGGSSSGFSLTASGGKASYMWSWIAPAGSTLPAGLTISTNVDSTGTIAGIPTTAGSYSVVVKVADSESPPMQTSANYTITVSAPGALVITSGLLPNGAVGASYGGVHTVMGNTFTGFPLSATGGVPGYTWSWAAAQGSSLPPGLNVSVLSFGGGNRCCLVVPVIAGTPTAAGTYKVVVTVTDSGSPPAHASANYTIVINDPQLSLFAISSGAPPNGTVAATYGKLILCRGGPPFCLYGFQLRATGGVTPYTWNWTAASGSSLPPGLGIQASIGGIISGTPTTAGSYNVVVTVTDSESPALQASANYTIVITPPPPPVISTSPVPAFTLNVAYVGFTFTAMGGQPPLTWSETGALPPGMMFSNSGVLSGTPTAAGSFPITVMAQDSAGQNAAPQNFTIQVFSKGFTPTAGTGTAREFHTATLLSTGKVLITGGVSEAATLATAELFDPASGSFSATGSMETARNAHTATLLSDGRVLVTGGLGPNGNELATAELFDPTNGSFSPTNSMGTARAYHTATLLNDGKVLVTGGLDATGNPVTTAELFDPTSKTFSPTGNMGTVRYLHTATLMNDGRVLLAGGLDDIPSAVATAELFDPNSSVFSSTGSMRTARGSHTATLLNDGRVLVTGGSDSNGNGNAFATAELFDPASGSFSATGSMEIARVYHTATLLSDGKVLVTGGDNLSVAIRSLAAAELFDPISGSFTATADMTTARESHTATLLNNGEVLVTGGVDVNTSGAIVLATAELFQ